MIQRQRLFLALLITSLILGILFVSPLVAASMPDSPAARLNESWHLAEERGAYHYNSTLEQTTAPLPTLANVGVGSKTQQILIEGSVDRPAETMQLKLWSQDGNIVGALGALEMKMEGGVTYSRGNGEAWQIVEASNDLFAPGGDPLSFLNAAVNITHLGSEQGAPVRYTRYRYTLDGPAFASYMHKKLTRDLTQKGELPPGVTLAPSPIYAQMVGEGELWIDEASGLPLRQIIDLQFPPTGNEQVSAHIVTDFSDWASNLPPLDQSWLQWQLQKTISVSDLQTLALSVLLLLSGLSFTLLVVIYARSRKLYTTFAFSIILSMVITPLLNSQQVSAFYDRQAERTARADQEDARNKEILEFQTSERQPSIAPHENPLEGVSLSGLEMNGASAAAAPSLSVSAATTNTAPANLCAALAQIGAQYNITTTQPITDFFNQLPVGVDLLDSDGDGLSLSQELLLCTDPNKKDSDGDTLHDGLEVNELGTEPGTPDSDGDAIPDNLEVAGFAVANKQWYLDSLSQDTNKDGIADGLECYYDPNARSLSCPDSDGDGAPDPWDTDDDNDQVIDKVDAARTAMVGDRTNGLSNGQFQFDVKDLAPNKPVYVDFQLRPTNPKHLWYTLNVLDWPSNDDQGQIQRMLDTTFYDMLAPADQPYADPQLKDGDLRLTPMLEVELSGTPLPLPLTTPRTSVDFSTVATGTVNLLQQGANISLTFGFANPTALYSAQIYSVTTCADVLTTTLPAYTFANLNHGAARTLNNQWLTQQLAKGQHVIQLSDSLSNTVCAPIPNIVNGGYNDKMVDDVAMAVFGVSVREKDNNGTLTAYLPLTLVRDGDENTPVAFSARMFYRSSTSTLGATQIARLIWMVESLNDSCSAIPASFEPTLADSERAEKWCEDKAHWLSNGSTIAHVYDDDWYLTGFDVREDQGAKVALAFQDPSYTVARPGFSPGKFSEDALWSLAQGLERSFLVGRSNGVTLTMTIADIVKRFDKSQNGSSTTEQRWGIDKNALRVQQFSFEHQSLVATLGMTVTPQLLATYFSALASSGQITNPTFLYAAENSARTLSLDVTHLITPTNGPTWNNGVTTGNHLLLSLDPSQVLSVTQASLNWKPYSYDSGTAQWRSADIEGYWESIGSAMEAVLAATYPDPADLDVARLVAQNYYLTLFRGIEQLIAMSNVSNFTPLSTPAQLSDSQILAISQVSANLGWALKNLVGQVDHILIELITKIAAKNTTLRAKIMDGTKLKKDFLDKVFGNSRMAGYIQNKDLVLGKCLVCKTLGDGGVIGIGAAVLTAFSTVIQIALTFSGDMNKLPVRLAFAIADTALATVNLASTLTTTIKIFSDTAGSKAASQKLWNGISKGIGKVSMVAAIGLVIGVAVSVGLFVHQVVAAGIDPTSLAFSQALAGLIASIIVAILLVVITSIPILGNLIAAIIAVIDVIANLVCVALGVQNSGTGKVNLCAGVTGLLTQAIQWLISDQSPLIDLENSNRLSFGNFDFALANPEKGLTVGNHINMSVDVGSAIYPANPQFTAASLAWAWQFYDQKQYKRSTFRYYLKEAPQNFVDDLALEQMEGDWQPPTSESWAADSKLVTSHTVTGVVPLADAGVNAKQPNLDLIEGFAIPVQECWLFPVPYPPFFANVCYIRAMKDQLRLSLRDSMIFDIFPSTLDHFYQLTARSNGGYALDWDEQFPTLPDADGDGLRSAAVGGNDPNDSQPDSDNDVLSDYYELANGSNPLLADEDGDSLSDADELRYGTNPHQADSDHDGLRDKDEIAGWAYVYAFNGATPLTTWVWSDPLEPNADGDDYLDLQERAYGFNPNLFSSSNILELTSGISDADQIVKPGASFTYSATVRNDLRNRHLFGLFETQSPASLTSGMAATQNFVLPPSHSFTQSGQINVQNVASQAISLTTRVGAASEDLTDQIAGRTLWLHLDESSGTQFIDSSLNNHNASCSGNGCPTLGGLGFRKKTTNFDGASDTVAISGSGSELGLAHDSFTLLAWVNGDSFTGKRALFNQANMALSNPFVLGFDGGRPTFGHISTVIAPAAISSSAWQRLAWRFNRGNNEAAIFVNGQRVAIGSAGSYDHSQLRALTFALSGTGNGWSRFDGLIDEVEIFPQALSDEEIEADNASGRGLVFYFPFENINGGVAGSAMLDNTDYANQVSCPPAGDTGYLCPASDRSGFIDKAYQFGAGDEYSDILAVSAAPNLNLSRGRGSFAIATWLHKLPGEGGWIMGNASASGYPALRVESDYARIQFDQCSLEAQSNGVLGGETSDQRWHHVVASFDGTTVTLYVDGTAIGSTSCAGKKPSAANSFYIGGRSVSQDGQGFQGELDELRIYDQALNANQVADLFWASSPKIELRFDEAPGRVVVRDSSFSGLDGSCSGSGCPITGIQGRINQAAHFDGVNDAILLASANTLGLTEHSFAVAAWVKANNWNAQPILGTLSTTGNDTLYLGLKNGTPYAKIGTREITATLPANSEPNRWMHLVWDYQFDAITRKGTLEFYVDGFRREKHSDLPPLLGTSNVYVGRYGTAYFAGDIDQVQLFRQALVTSQNHSDLFRQAPQLSLHFEGTEGATAFVNDVYPADLYYRRHSTSTPNATCSEYHGTQPGSNCPKVGTKGRLYQGVSFDGINDGLTVAEYLDVHITDKFSLAFWVRPMQRKNGVWQTLINKGYTKQRSYDLSIKPGSMTLRYAFDRCAISNSAFLGQIEADAGELVENRWNHVVFTYDGKEAVAYLNGSKSASTVDADNLCFNPQSIQLGRGAGEQDYFAGEMDEVTVYRSVLSAADVAEMASYQGGWFDTSVSHSILIDNDLPTLRLDVNTTILAKQERVLAIFASDPTTAIDKVEVRINNGAWQAAVRDDESWLFNFKPAAEGSYLFDLRASDTAGNQATAQKTLFIDASAPVLGTVNAEGGAILPVQRNDANNSWDVTLFGQVSAANSPAAGVWVELFDGNGLSASGRLTTTLSGNSWQINYPFALRPSGFYTISLEAVDEVGNRSSKTVRATIDGAPATATIDNTGASTVTIGSGVILTGSVSDGSGGGESLTSFASTTQAATAATAGVSKVEISFHPEGRNHLSSAEWQSDGLVLHLRLDEPLTDTNGLATTTFVDGSGKGNHATCSQCPIPGNPGNIGNAVQFDGNDDSLSVAPFGGLLSDNAYAIGGWVKPAAAASGLDTIQTWVGTGNGVQQWLRYDASQQRFVYSDTVAGVKNSSTGYARDQWHHWLLTVDSGNQAALYLNGKVATSFTTTVRPTISDTLRLGESLQGLLDDMVVYDRALQADEVAAFYRGYAPILRLPLDANSVGDGSTVQDESRYNHTPVLHLGNPSDVAYAVAGKVGSGALAFDGVNDYISVPSNPALNLRDGLFTLYAWVYPQPANATTRYPILDGQPSGVPAWLAYPSLTLVQRNKLEVGFGDGGRLHTYTTGALLTENAWNFVAVSFDGATYNIYINGLLRASTAQFAGVSPYPTTRFNIGGNGNGGFKGLLDEVVLYRQALSADEIASLYHQGWQPVNLSASGAGVSDAIWSYATPDRLQGSFQIQLRTTDVNGNVSFGWLGSERWHGVIDTQPLADGPGGVGATDGFSSLNLWLRADRGTNRGVTDWVYSWFDGSGKGLNAAAPIFTRSPYRIANQINGQPVVRFDGVDDRLTINDSDLLDFVADRSFAIFSVVNAAEPAVGSIIAKDVGSNQPSWWTRLENGKLRFLLDDGAGHTPNLTSAATVTNSAHILMSYRDQNANLLRLGVDGTVATTADNTTASLANANPVVIGDVNNAASRQLQGDIAEIIILDGDVNNAQRNLVHNYLSARYNIAIPVGINLYHGDDAAQGDYDLDVAGIGQEADGAHLAATSAGLLLSANPSSLNNGEYLVVGHKSPGNDFISADDTPNGMSRMSRVWYLEKTGNLAATVTFDFKAANLANSLLSQYNLLYRPNEAALFAATGVTGTVAGDQVSFDLGNGQLQNGYYTLGCATGSAVIVSNNANSGPGSLRQAINDVCSGGTVLFAPGLAGQTILLTSGEIVLNKSLTIDGAAAPGVTISGNNAHRLFRINRGYEVILRYLTLINGRETAAFNPCLTFACGGAIYNDGTLTIQYSTLKDNWVEPFPSGSGGAIHNGGSLLLLHSTLANNSARFGGGIHNGGTATLLNSTLSGNTAENFGDSISNAGTLLVNHSTLLYATSTYGANLYNQPGAVSLVQNSLTGQIDGSVTPLQDNGGPTFTHLPLANSPVVDASSGNCLGDDQRGVARPQGAACDSGSVEYNFASNEMTIGNASSKEGDSGSNSLNFVVYRPNPSSTSSVGFATANLSALAGQDYSATSGVLVFAAGEVSRTVTVQLMSDLSAEADETLKLVLSNPSNGSLLRSEATGTIGNDDGLDFNNGPGGVGDNFGESELVWWLRSGDISGANGVNITTWPDSSGYGKDATQSNAAIQPSLQSNTLNGQPVVHFDDTTPERMQMSDHAALVSDRQTIFVVGQHQLFDTDVLLSSNYAYTTAASLASFKNTSTAALVEPEVINLAATSAGPLIELRSDGTHAIAQVQNSGGSWQVVTTAADNGYHLQTMRWGADNSLRYFRDGSLVGEVTGADLQPTLHQSTVLGAQASDMTPPSPDHLDGNLAEVIVYNQDLNSAQRILVENYLSAKYNLPISNTVDFYHGDEAAQQEYDWNVIGIGAAADGDHMDASGAGLSLSGEPASLDAGDYLLAGHKSTSNAFITTTIPAGVAARWQRVWYLEKTGNLSSTLTFDLSSGGINQPVFENYRLLYSASPTFTFSSQAITPTIRNDRISFALSNGELQNGYYTLACLDRTLVVTNSNDSGAGSLREAVGLNPCYGTTITFDPSLAGKTIGLTSSEITINRRLTIDGSNAPGLVISGNGGRRVFRVESGGEVTLRNLTVANGFSNVAFGPCGGTPCGGGILNRGSLTLQGVTVRNNMVEYPGNGGGIYNSGTLTVSQSTVHDNQVSLSTAVYGYGGGIFNSGTLAVVNSTLGGNSAGTANRGHAIASNGTGTILASTIADGGTALYLTGGSVTLRSSILTSGCTAINGATLDADSSNLGACGGAQAGNAQLGTLQDNGGKSWTMLPGVGSAALNALATCSTSSDQRGTGRPQFGNCDIGAVEVGNTTLQFSQTTERSSVAAGERLRYTLVISNSGGDWATGVSISDTLPAALTLVENSLALDPANMATTVATTTTSLPALVSGLTIAPLSQITVSYWVTVSANFSGQISNTAQLSTTASNAVILNDTSSVSNTVLQQQLSVSDASVSEGNDGSSAMRFVISRTANLLDTQVDVATIAGTASSGNDFAPLASPLFLPAGGDLTQTVTISLTGDLLVEEDETFSLHLSNLQGAQLLDGEGIGTISNDDSATLSVSGSSASEHSGVLSFTLSLSAATDVDVSVIVTSRDGTASSGSGDYNPVSGQIITLTAGALTQTVVISVTDETLVEATESLTLTLGNLQNGGRAVTLGRNASTGLILNDDVAMLIFSPGITMSEGLSGTQYIPFTTTLAGEVQGGFDLLYALNDESAQSADNDYLDNDGVLHFAGLDGEAQTITVTINGDNKVEGSEQLSLALAGITGTAVSAILAANSPQTITLLNDDQTTIRLSGGITQSEGNATVVRYTFTATLENGVQGGFDLVYSTDDETANAASGDYVDQDGSLTFAGMAGETKRITVTVISDLAVEGDEQFALNLQGLSNLTSGVLSDMIGFTDSPQPGIIANDDQSRITLQAGAPILEGTLSDQSYPFSVTLSQAVPGGLSIGYTTFNQSADTTDGDFQAASQELIFSGVAGETQQVNVKVYGDSKIEGDETFALVLTSATPFVSAVATETLLIDSQPQTATLLNDDKIWIDVSDALVEEAAQTAFFTVSLSVVNDVTTTVAYQTVDHSAQAGEDYVAASGILTLPPAALSGLISVTIQDDALLESNESFSLTLTSPQPSEIVSIQDGEAVGMIINDDPPLLSIDDIGVNEGAGKATFIVMLSGVSNRDAHLTYNTVAETASAEDDFTTIASATLTIPAGQISSTIDITIHDDLLEEEVESFTLVITNPVNVLLVDMLARATIVDNEMPSITVNTHANQAIANVGEVITYTYQVTNTGAITIINLLAVDDALGMVNLDANTLAAGATTSGQLSKTVSAGDLPGPLVNHVLFTATTALNRQAVVSTTASVNLIHAAVTLSKTVSIATIRPLCTAQTQLKVPVNTQIVYCYTLSNRGEEALLMGELVDSHLGLLLPATSNLLVPMAQVQHLVSATLSVSTTNIATWTLTLPLRGVAALASAAESAISTSGVTAATILISSVSDDQDGDTIPDNLESAADLDGDNIPNFLDQDADGDSRTDQEEVGPDPLHPLDNNQNNIPDYLEAASDGFNVYLPMVAR